MKSRLLAALFCLLAAWVRGAAPSAEFQPGKPWLDQQGAPIDAHGGGVLLHQGVYYWFGQSLTTSMGSNAAPASIQVYTSTNLYHWTNAGCALGCSDDPAHDLVRGCRIERPKVIFHAPTGKFVMWFHLEFKNSSNTTARAGVAVADRPTGPYRYRGSFRLHAGRTPRTVNEVSQLKRVQGPWSRDLAGGQMVRDMTLFVDDDGAAYHVAVSEDSQTLHISRLTADYLGVSGEYARVFPGGLNKAPVLFKHGGKYWLLTSDDAPRPPYMTRLAVADSIWGPWTSLGNPWVGPDERKPGAGDVQPAFVLPVAGKPDDFIFLGDQWQTGQLPASRHAWLPVQFRQDGRPFLQWLERWDLSFFNQAAQPFHAALDSGGQTFTITAPGLLSFKAGFEATFLEGPWGQPLLSSQGALIEPVKTSVQATPMGWAQVATATLRFEKEKVELHFRLSRLLDVPAVIVQAGLRNIGSQARSLVSIRPVRMSSALAEAQALQTVGDPGEWLVTPLDASTESAKSPAVALGELRQPMEINEYAGFYRADGKGFLLGPVGEPIAYLSAVVKHGGSGKAMLDVAANMSRARVNPGELRWGQPAVLLFEPPRQALTRWTEWIAKTHRARTNQGALSGWSSWYHYTDRVTGQDVQRLVDTVLQSGGRLRPQTIQLDDGYQDLDGQWEANKKFPEGLPWYARRIAATGARPGLWMAPTLVCPETPWVQQPANLATVWDRKFDPPDGSRLKGSGWLDPTRVRARERIADVIRKAVESGFTYLKLDFNRVGTELWHDSRKTSFEVLRDHYTNIREAAGDDTYLLFCEPQPNRAVVGLVDAAQAGHAAWRGGVRSAMNDLLRSYHLNGRWFAIDPTCYYLATGLPDVGRIEGGWPLVKTWISMVGLSCGAAITSDPWPLESLKPHWNVVEILTPPAKERTEVLDLGTQKDWPRLVGLVKRDWGTAAVALLWNPGKTPQVVTLDLAQAGLDPQREYAVWSFWDDKFLGFAKGTWTTPFLPETGCQQVRLTEVDRARRAPVLVGSTLHIYCGAAEIARFRAEASNVEVEFTDAGARAGHLFVYSPERLFLRDAAGCVVRAVERADEAIWRIAITDRQPGRPQRIQLGIAVPLRQQPWFWAVTVFAVFMAGSGVWWTVQRQRTRLALARLEQQNALERERLRIARDIHDEVGAKLTKMGELIGALDEPAVTPTGQPILRDMAETTRDVVQAMDEIVWAVNPHNDTLENMANYLVHYTEEFLQPTGIACELDVPVLLPAVPVPTEVRHNLFLAVKEALNNAVKHSAARHIRVHLAYTGGLLTIGVGDDGGGFDPQSRAIGADGLENMRGRLAAIGGQFDLRTAPGQGTTITLRVPLAETKPS